MTDVEEQEPLWRPSPESCERAAMTRFMRWAGERRGREFGDYGELWQWSVDELEEFWECIWEYSGVRSSRPYSGCSPTSGCPARDGSREPSSTTPRTCSWAPPRRPDGIRAGRRCCTAPSCDRWTGCPGGSSRPGSPPPPPACGRWG